MLLYYIPLQNCESKKTYLFLEMGCEKTHLSDPTARKMSSQRLPKWIKYSHWEHFVHVVILSSEFQTNASLNFDFSLFSIERF